MMEILHHLIYTCKYLYMYIYVHYTTRVPVLVVYEAYIKSCRISSINSKSHGLPSAGNPPRFGKWASEVKAAGQHSPPRRCWVAVKELNLSCHNWAILRGAGELVRSE